MNDQWPQAGEHGWLDEAGYHFHTFKVLPSGNTLKVYRLNGKVVSSVVEDENGVEVADA